jgi:hypothetical protein
MSASPQLIRALQQVLGSDASGELLSHIASTSETRADVAELRHEMRVGFEKLRADFVERIEQRYADTVKWSFVFWVGAVTTIAVLFRTLR